MTRQQAIWTLIDCRRILIDGLVSVQADAITEAFDMAIDALKYLEAMKGERAMSDLISRQDAIDGFYNVKVHAEDCTEYDIGYNDGIDYAISKLSVMPSAEAVQWWIPCSERLPSEDGRYLVCMVWKYDNMEVLRWADGWNCHRGYDGKIRRESEIDGADITAWMPLPEPYKGGEDE